MSHSSDARPARAEFLVEFSKPARLAALARAVDPQSHVHGPKLDSPTQRVGLIAIEPADDSRIADLDRTIGEIDPQAVVLSRR